MKLEFYAIYLPSGQSFLRHEVFENIEEFHRKLVKWNRAKDWKYVDVPIPGATDNAIAELVQ